VNPVRGLTLKGKDVIGDVDKKHKKQCQRHRHRVEGTQCLEEWISSLDEGKDFKVPFVCSEDFFCSIFLHRSNKKGIEDLTLSNAMFLYQFNSLSVGTKRMEIES
jgi:hypothetical protein